VVVALVVCLVGSSLLDVAAGNTAALGEAQHLTDFVGLAVVWLLSRPVLHAPRLA
jgi:xanthine/uracil permease